MTMDRAALDEAVWRGLRNRLLYMRTLVCRGTHHPNTNLGLLVFSRETDLIRRRYHYLVRRRKRMV